MQTPSNCRISAQTAIGSSLEKHPCAAGGGFLDCRSPPFGRKVQLQQNCDYIRGGELHRQHSCQLARLALFLLTKRNTSGSSPHGQEKVRFRRSGIEGSLATRIPLSPPQSPSSGHSRVHARHAWIDAVLVGCYRPNGSFGRPFLNGNGPLV
jgi:hypothetical protein